MTHDNRAGDDMHGAMAAPVRVVLAAVVLFLLLIALLVHKNPPLFHSGADPDKVVRRLALMHETLEKHLGLFGAYPSTGGAWVLVGNAASGGDGIRGFPSNLGSLPPFVDPQRAPAVSIIYASDGKDYKLVVHLADKQVCVEARKIDPSLTDPARILFISGFLRGPAWRVTQPWEMHEADDAMKKAGTYLQPLDQRLERYVWGTCWAFGYWTPGAARW